MWERFRGGGQRQSGAVNRQPFRALTGLPNTEKPKTEPVAFASFALSVLVAFWASAVREKRRGMLTYEWAA